jgi:hypothetical protein
MIVALFALTLTLAALSSRATAEDHCMTRDPAVCAQDPACHWDYAKRGCYAGAAERVDPCGAHGDKTICEQDVSIGCKWSTNDNKCEQTN